MFTETFSDLRLKGTEDPATLTKILTRIKECQNPENVVWESSFKELPDWAEALFSVANIILIIFSLCGNFGALLVVSKSKLSKWSTKSYLMCLALFDLILTITSPTVDLSQLMSRYGGWIFGEFLCKAIPFIQTVAVIGVAFCLVVIAIERYLSVVRAFDPPSSSSRWRGFIPSITVLSIWIIAIGSGLPNLWYYKRTSFWTMIPIEEYPGYARPRNETCDTTYYICQRTKFDQSNIAYYSVLGLAFFILTACFLFCYISIIIFLRKHGQFRKSSPNLKAARNQKTLKLILGLILLYLVCRVPLWTYVVVTNIYKFDVTMLTLSLFYFFHILSNINTLANPFIYAIFNDSIRSNQSSGGVFRSRSGSHKSPAIIFCCCRTKRIEPMFGDNPPTVLDNSTNKYDFTKQKTCIPSISTQKFFLSERNEFPVSSAPLSSSASLSQTLN